MLRPKHFLALNHGQYQHPACFKPYVTVWPPGNFPFLPSSATNSMALSTRLMARCQREVSLFAILGCVVTILLLIHVNTDDPDFIVCRGVFIDSASLQQRHRYQLPQQLGKSHQRHWHTLLRQLSYP